MIDPPGMTMIVPVDGIHIKANGPFRHSASYTPRDSGHTESEIRADPRPCSLDYNPWWVEFRQKH